MNKAQLIFQVRVAGAGLLLLSSVVLGFNCSGFQSNSELSGNPALFGSQEAAPPIGFLSAEQTIKAMISVTGTEGLGELTDPADDLINSTFGERSGSLPSSNDIYQATGPTLIAAANLASVVCAKAVDRDRAIGDGQAQDRLFFREFAFSAGLGTQSSDSVTGAFDRLARNAWRRDPTVDEISQIVSFAQQFSSGVSASDPAQTRLLAVSLCTAALASIDALTY